MIPRRQVLHLAVTAGEILLANGAEIFRVQETIERILAAFGLQNATVYVLSNGIFASLDELQEDQCVALRVVPAQAIHLARIAAVNELSREIEKDPDPAKLETLLSRLRSCAEVPAFPLWMRMLACAVGSFFFCLLLGGGVGDSAASFVCGAVLNAFLFFYGRKGRSRFMHTLLGAGLVSSMAVGFAALFSALSLDYIIIGAIMSLVPGVALTTSIRDFFGGDFLSGTIHLIETALTGICIAVGVGAILQLWQFVAGGALL